MRPKDFYEFKSSLEYKIPSQPVSRENNSSARLALSVDLLVVDQLGHLSDKTDSYWGRTSSGSLRRDSRRLSAIGGGSAMVFLSRRWGFEVTVGE